MAGMGLLDRLIPIVANISKETRMEYQTRSQNSDIRESEPPTRTPVYEFERVRIVQDDIIREMNLDPRLLRNIRRISQYLTEDELYELIQVANKPGRFEI
jgi:hypothetical protein